MDRKAGTRYEARGTRIISKSAKHGLIFSLFLLSLSPFALNPVSAFGAEKWPGVDESVVEKVASEHGREAREPLINTDQGDLLLFVFLLAGTVGGFAAGYYWRTLMEGRKA